MKGKNPVTEEEDDQNQPKKKIDHALIRVTMNNKSLINRNFHKRLYPKQKCPSIRQMKLEFDTLRIKQETEA